MKKIHFIAVALMATITTWAQNIAVVSPSNVTKVRQTLDEAISEAEDGSIIYLPGGGFQIKDETIITKRLTIMGVSHRGDTDNVDGATVIAGNICFVGGSSGSSVTGVYVSGDINVGDEENYVSNLTVRFCNVNSIQVKNSNSSGMIINQCYLRNTSNFGNCNVRLENNILHSAININGGIISNNVITSNHYVWRDSNYPLRDVSNSLITNNFLLDPSSIHRGPSCSILNNCIGTGSWGEECIQLDEGKSWDDVFGENNNKGVSIKSDYSIKGKWGKNAGTDGKDIGIYGGSGFKPNALAPIPRIVSKEVDEHTDGSGKLQIKVTVRAQ